MTIYYIYKWASGGFPITGVGRSATGSIPSGAIECTEAQYKEPFLYAVDETNLTITSQPGAILLQAQSTQRAIVKQSFTNAANANVTDSNGITWEGGELSGNSIFLGCQLAQQAGATTITLYDAAKAPHSMTVAEGMAVAALIGTAYQTALGKKNSLYAQITAASTVADVEAIVWN